MAISEPILAVRTPASRPPTRQVLNRAYKVYLVKVDDFPGSSQDQKDAVKEGITSRLREFFADVAAARGNPRTIVLYWVDAVSDLWHDVIDRRRRTQTVKIPRDQEIVLFFTTSFQSGFLFPWLQRMGGGTNGAAYRQELRDFNGNPPREVGLCHYEDIITETVTQLDARGRPVGTPRTTTVEPAWVFVEVHMQTAANTDLGYMNQTGGPLLVGNHIGGVAIHEIMHAKVDPHHFTRDRNGQMDRTVPDDETQPAAGHQFNIHRVSQGGDGVATPGHYRVPHTAENVRLVKEHLTSSLYPSEIPKATTSTQRGYELRPPPPPPPQTQTTIPGLGNLRL